MQILQDRELYPFSLDIKRGYENSDVLVDAVLQHYSFHDKYRACISHEEHTHSLTL